MYLCCKPACFSPGFDATTDVHLDADLADPAVFAAKVDGAMKTVISFEAPRAALAKLTKKEEMSCCVHEGYAVAFFTSDGKLISPPGVSIGTARFPPLPCVDKFLNAKVQAHLHGDEIVAPGPLATVCCYFCPFVCACKPRLALAGVSKISGHPSIAGVVVTGSMDTAANDLKVAVAVCDAVGLTIMDRECMTVMTPRGVVNSYTPAPLL